MLAAAGVGIVWFGLAQLKKAGSLEERRFEETVRALAARTGGEFSLEAAAEATGKSREEAQRRLRALCARGVCDMDFTKEGQILFRMTPAEESRQILLRR